MTAERIVIVGNGRMSQACAAILRDRVPDRLKLVVAEARPGPAQSRLAGFCNRHGIQVVFHEGSINDPDTFERIAAVRPDLLLSVDNFQIFGKQLLELPRRGCVNFHNGPLDRYRGVNIPSWALFNAETEHGVSWHTMEATVDTGLVLAATRFPLRGDETALALTLECVRAGIDLFETHLDRLLDPGNTTTAAADLPTESAASARADRSGDTHDTRDAHHTHATAKAAPPMPKGRLYTRKDLPNGGRLDLRWPYEAVDRMLRATDFRPYPNPFTYARLETDGGPLIVNAVQALAERTDDPPGRILFAGERLVTVCADRVLELTAVMLEPDREASVADAVETLGLAAGDHFA